MSRSARVSARRSNVARRDKALCHLAHFPAQTRPVPASAPFAIQTPVPARSQARSTRHLLARRASAICFTNMLTKWPLRLTAAVVLSVAAAAIGQQPVFIGLVREDGYLIPIATVTP